MAIGKHRNSRAFETRDEVGLRAVDDDEVGRSERMRSKSGSTSAPTRGRVATSGGKASKLDTPTTSGPAPMANSISVTAGTRLRRCGRPPELRTRHEAAHASR